MRAVFLYDDVWNPSIIPIHLHQKLILREWEVRSRQEHLVSNAAEDTSKPHMLPLNACQGYHIDYC